MKRRLINSLIFILVLILVILIGLGIKSNSFGIESYLSLEKKSLEELEELGKIKKIIFLSYNLYFCMDYLDICATIASSSCFAASGFEPTAV